MLKNLSSSEIKSLEEFVYSIREEENSDKIKYQNFYTKNQFPQDSLKIETYISIIKKIDLRVLQNASDIYFYGINKLQKANFPQMKFKKKYSFIYEPGGNDRYETKYKESYGYGKRARNSGIIGLFLDENGDDI